MGPDPNDVKELDQIQHEVDSLRKRTEALVGELERRLRGTVDGARQAVERVKHAANLPARIREHPRATAGAGIALLAAGVGFVLLLQRRIVMRRRLVTRSRTYFTALGHLLGDPARALRRGPALGERLLGAAAVALVSTLVRSLTVGGLRRVGRPLLPPPSAV
jgi:hypothetical protein